MPHERSRAPHQVSGVTASSSSPIRSVPSQKPVCASRTESIHTRPFRRTNWRGSRVAGMAPVQVRSKESSYSPGSSTTRSRFSGSSTSTRNGPTEVSPRSVPSSREARTTRCTPRWTTAANASVTPRFGYCPTPTP